LVLAPLTLASPLNAQSVPIAVRGNIEVAGLGGFNGGSSLSSESTLAPGAPPGTSPQKIASPQSNGSIGFQVGWYSSTRLVLKAEWGYLAGGKSVYNQVYVPNQTSYDYTELVGNCARQFHARERRLSVSDAGDAVYAPRAIRWIVGRGCVFERRSLV
jgi:hypothetical protein